MNLNETYKNNGIIVTDTCKNNMMNMNETCKNSQMDMNEASDTLIYRLGKYVSCSRCRYKVLNYNPRLVQSETEIHKLQFFDILCSHCKKDLQRGCKCLGQDFVTNEDLLKRMKWEHPFHKRRAVSASKIESEAINRTASESNKGKPKFTLENYLQKENTNKTKDTTHCIPVSSSDTLLTTNKNLQLFLKESKNKDLPEIYTSKDSVASLDVKDFREEIKNIQKIIKSNDEIDNKNISKQIKIVSDEILNDINEFALNQEHSNLNKLLLNLESKEQIAIVTSKNNSLSTFVSPFGESSEEFKYCFGKPKVEAPGDEKELRDDKTSSEIIKEIKINLDKKKVDKGIRRKEDESQKIFKKNKPINSVTEISPDKLLRGGKNNIPKKGMAGVSKSDTLIQSKKERKRDKYDKRITNVIKEKSVKQKSDIDKVSKSTRKNYDNQKLTQDAIQFEEIVSKKGTFKDLKQMKEKNYQTQGESKITKIDEDEQTKDVKDRGQKQINAKFVENKQMQDIKLTQKLERAQSEENKKGNGKEKEQDNIQPGKMESKKYKQGLSKHQRKTKENVVEDDKIINENIVVKKQVNKKEHESKLKTKSQTRVISPDKKLIKTGEQEERITKEEKMIERQNINKLDPRQIKLLNTSLNNIVHLLTKFKQDKYVSSRGKAKKIDTNLNIHTEKTNAHENQAFNQSSTSVSIDTELELDLNNTNNQKDMQLREMIVGEKIVKYKQLSPLKQQKEEILAVFHKNAYDDNSYPLPQEYELEYQNEIIYKSAVDVIGKRVSILVKFRRKDIDI